MASVEVEFRDVPNDPSVESSIYRWVARLEAMHIDVIHARVTVGRAWRKRTMVSLALSLPTGSVETVAVHEDRYVGVADAFRAAKQRIQPTKAQAFRACAVA